MMKLARCVALVALLAPVSAVAQNFEAGLRAFQTGDYPTALREWRSFAEQGDAVAQLDLGILHTLGHGVSQDYATAHMWLNIAAASGIEAARDSRDLTANQMTAESIAEAQRRARTCMESAYQDCD